MASLNPALSDFGQQLVSERERLLSQLVQRLAGVQPNDEQHCAVLEACLEAVKNHTFIDTNPRLVTEQYDRLDERFGEYAQFEQQRALQLLRRHLLGLQLESSQYDFQHRLLAFLYAASRSPLGARYPGGELVQALEQVARTAVVGPPTYLSDASSDGGWLDDMGAYSPGSQLSEWSQLEAEDAEEAGEPSLGLAVDATMSDGPGDDSNGSAAAAGASAVGRLPGSPLPGAPPIARLAPPPSPHQRRESPYTRASLSVWLASKRSGGQPARVLEPRLCFHERELVQQVVHLLKGVSSPGPAFQLGAAGAHTYTVRPGVHLHSSSHGSIAALLQRFARVGSSLRRVQAFCAAAQRVVGTPPGPWTTSKSGSGIGMDGNADIDSQLLALPTVAAFAAAVAGQQRGLQQQVLVIEAALASDALLTLLQLQKRTASLFEQAAALERLVRRCCRRAANAAETAAGLLSRLHEVLQIELLRARSQGGVLASMLLQVFAASCRPLLGTLHGWLYRGVLHDPWAEFFVQASGADIPTDSPRFWSEAYTLRMASQSSGTASGGTSSVPAAPCFLLPLVPDILAAGKSTLLLQAYSSWRLAAAAAAASGRGGGAARRVAQVHASVLPPAVHAASEAHSPSKQRLSEFGALGFAIAAGAQGCQPYGLPQQAAAMVMGRADHTLALLGEGVYDGTGRNPPQLHQHMAGSLQAQLQQHLEMAKAAPEGLHATSQPTRQLLARLAGDSTQEEEQQDAVGEEAAASDGVGLDTNSSSSSSTSGTSGGTSHLLLAEWQPPSPTCGGQALLLPEPDALPLAAVPITPEGLPVAQYAVIQPEMEPTSKAALGACGAAGAAERGHSGGCSDACTTTAAAKMVVKSSTSSSCGPSRNHRLPSMAERMQQAAAARVQQAVCAAAVEQLPQLLIEPAPLEALARGAAAAAPGRNGGGGGGRVAGRVVPPAGQSAQPPAHVAAEAAEAVTAADFESSGWKEHYQRMSAALSQQLEVLDCLGGSSGGVTGSSMRQQLISSYGVPLGLPQYTGNATEQLWGRGRCWSPTSCGEQVSSGSASNSRAAAGSMLGAGQRAPLQPEHAVEAPSLPALLQRSLLQPVQAQMEAVGGALCAALLRHGLLRQLAALRDVYLMGSPLLEPFVSFLLRRISTTTGGMDRLSEFELNASLQDALVAGGKADLLRAAARILPAPSQGHATHGTVAGGRGRGQQAGPAGVSGAAGRGAGPAARGPAGAGPAAAAAAAGGVLPRVQQLGRLRIRVEPGWPLSLVVGEEMLEQYNAVLVLLLQLRWVKRSLQAVRYTGWKAGRRSAQGAAARDGLQHQMVHLVDAVMQYINDRVVAAGTWLEQAVEGCTSLDEMHACRAKYLRAVTRYCLLGSEGVARLVHEGLLHLLNACLHYCALRTQAAAAATALQTLVETGGGPAVAELLGGRKQEEQQRPQFGQATVEEDGDLQDATVTAVVDGSSGIAPQQPPASLPWAGRRAELQRRAADAAAQLARLRHEFGNRQRLLLRVLSTKAAEAGSHADELRQLLGALDYNGYFQRSMA